MPPRDDEADELEDFDEEKIEGAVDQIFEEIDEMGSPRNMTKPTWIAFLEGIAQRAIDYANTSREELGREPSRVTVNHRPIPKGKRVLITSDQAVDVKTQPTKPCSDCPWARTSINGWLGPNTAEEWIEVAHRDLQIDCHTVKGAQCAGAAIYRRNTCKHVHPPLLLLEADRALVFSNRAEFLEHHAKGPSLPKPKRRKR